MTGRILSGHTGSLDSSSTSFSAAAVDAQRLSVTATLCKHASRFRRPEVRLSAMVAGRSGLIERGARTIERTILRDGLIMLTS